MGKVFITGNAGSGKTTTSKKIGLLRDANVYSLDKIVWQSGWQKTPAEEKHSQIDLLIAEPGWVIDGVSHQVFDAADTIIFLDIPLYKCLLNIVVRFFKNGLGTRDELPSNCPEYIGVFKALRVALKYQKYTRPDILKRIALHIDSKTVIHIRGYEDLNTALSSFEKEDYALAA